MTRRTDGSAFVVVDDVFTNVALVALTATASTGALLVTASHFGWTPNFSRHHAARSTDALTALVAHYDQQFNMTDEISFLYFKQNKKEIEKKKRIENVI